MPALRSLFILIAFFCPFAAAEARTITDAAGRVIEVPDKIERVLAAGPPASVLVYVLAPEKLAGWVRERRGRRRPFSCRPSATCRPSGS